jgi:hypothetical protein
MAFGRTSNRWSPCLVIVIVLVGLIVGSIIGEYLAGYVPALAKGSVIGFSPTTLEFADMLDFTVGFSFKVNIVGLIGVVLALVIFRLIGRL